MPTIQIPDVAEIGAVLIAQQVKGELPSAVQKAIDTETSLLLSTVELERLKAFDALTNGHWLKFPREKTPDNQAPRLSGIIEPDYLEHLPPHQIADIHTFLSENPLRHSVVRCAGEAGNSQAIILFHDQSKATEGKSSTIGSGTFGVIRVGQALSSGEIVAIKVATESDRRSHATKAAFEKEHYILTVLEKNTTLQGSFLGFQYRATTRPATTGSHRGAMPSYKTKAYIPQKLAAGKELFSILAAIRDKKQPPFSTEELIELSAAMVAEIATIHQKNVIHGDLKPENIMCHIETNPETRKISFHIKAIDYGLSIKIPAFQNLVVLKNLKASGTSSYLAPEIAKMDLHTEPPELMYYTPYPSYSKAADIYALGVILAATFYIHEKFYLIRKDNWRTQEMTSKPPSSSSTFEDENESNKLKGMQRLVLKCLAPAPEERPSISDLAETIEQIAQGTPHNALPLLDKSYPQFKIDENHLGRLHQEREQIHKILTEVSTQLSVPLREFTTSPAADALLAQEIITLMSEAKSMTKKLEVAFATHAEVDTFKENMKRVSEKLPESENKMREILGRIQKTLDEATISEPDRIKTPTATGTRPMKP